MKLTMVTHIPDTPSSWPFGRAAIACNFEALGYTEEEYFFSGLARIYQELPHGKAGVVYEGAPYTNRVIFRMPADPKWFSGNVVIEILNSTAGIDIDRIWINSWKYLTRNGDAYVGITSRGNVLDALKRFDSDRYAALDWSNPMPERSAPEGVPTEGPFRFRPEQEMGLFWDMLEDCAQLLLSDAAENPLKDYPSRRLFLTGWSQSTSYIARYLKTFYNEEKPLYAGYLSAGGGCVPMGLNAYEPQVPPFKADGIPVGSVMGAAQPVIAVNTESENRLAYWYGDFDEPRFKFRTYQIPGSSHDSKYNIFDYYGLDPYMTSKTVVHREAKFRDGENLDYPYEPIFCAAFRNLFAWANQGIPAPHALKIETNIVRGASTDPLGTDADNLTDVFGNSKGGIRTPAIDYPTGTYCSHAIELDGSVSAMFGKVIPFSPEKLKVLYGSLENYRHLVEQGAEQMQAKGFLLPEDKQELIDRIVATAKERGLE